MKYILPRLTPVLVIVAAVALIAAPLVKKQEASPPPDAAAPDREGPANAAGLPPHRSATTPKPQTVGDQLLAQAATRLQRRGSVAARLRHQIYLQGQQLSGIGSYWQQGTGEDLRVRLELQIVGQDASLLQVSDSRFRWLERRLPTGRTVTRLDLRQLRADPSLTPASFDGLAPGSATWSSTESDMIAHTGGLPSLLASLAENFSFLPPQAMRLAAHTATDAQPTSIPVFAVVGHWRTEKIAALLDKTPPQSAPDAAGETSSAEDNPHSNLNPQPSTFPHRFPQEVLLLVGQSDFFPYRIEYRRLETPPTTADGPAIPYQLSANPLVVLELIDVAFDAPIAAGQFDYAPGDAEWSDQTATVLERLRRERNQLATRPTPARK